MRPNHTRNRLSGWTAMQGARSIPVAKPGRHSVAYAPMASPVNLSGYAQAPPLAFPGWRLSVTGAPPGGQYHGFEAIGAGPGAPPVPPRSAVAQRWQGVPLAEGQTVSAFNDYVYRSPSELKPRSNASGDANTAWAAQEEKGVSFAEVPGAYASRFLSGPGASSTARRAIQPSQAHTSSFSNRVRRRKSGLGAAFPVVQPRPGSSVGPIGGSVPPISVSPIARPIGTPAPWAGNNLVNQNPPTTPGPIYTVPDDGYQPLSPAPAPVVSAPPSAYYPITAEPYSCQNPDPQCTAAGETCGPFPDGCMPYSVSNPDPRCAAEGATGGPYPSCTPNYSTNNPDPRCTAIGETGGPYPNCIALPTPNLSTVDTLSSSTAGNDPQCLAIGELGGPYPNCTPASAAAVAAAQPAASSSSGIMGWLESSSLISGVPNMLIAAGLLLLVMKRK